MAVSFIKKGKKAQQEIAKDTAKQEAMQEGQAYRFWIPNDTETQITFLDGKLQPDGLLDVSMYYEHQIFMNGSWKNWFVCTSEDEPCPICEGSDNPALVGVFTVIDHSEWVSKKDQSVHKDEVKLFVAKRDTIKMLQKIATKRKGLAGATFDVSRSGDKSPSVGNMFDFIGKKSVPILLKKYKAELLDYDKVIHYKSADELRKLGFGSMSIGGEETEEVDDTEYDDDL